MLEHSAKLQLGPRIAVSGASFFGTEGLIDLLEAPEAQEASKLTLMDHPSATGQRCIAQSLDQFTVHCCQWSAQQLWCRLTLAVLLAGRLRSIHQDRPETSSNGSPTDDRDMLITKSDSTKDLVKGPAESKGALGFLRSREGRLGVLSMVLLVFQGTALSLILRYSR